MTSDDPFVILMAAMRRAQKRYFATRRPQDLDAARELERLADKEIDRLITKQRDLFGKV